jgi:type III restriction enzyme
MELKQYQQRSIDILSKYLKALKDNQVRQVQADALKIPFNWVTTAWDEIKRGTQYRPRMSGDKKPIPSVCLKVPTGGGKTLLAVRAIDAINTYFTRLEGSLVLWIVPTTQIYRQTLQALRDRAHPYRQFLDISSGGRTLILEKDSLFSPEDLRSNLAILLLMLPSANRQNKETLRLFQDRSGFEAFFPPEYQLDNHGKLLEGVPNLDVYKDSSGVLLKSSLGNTLRMLKPVIILDEGHKAYSESAQKTLLGFNPSFILELSATPAPQSNILVHITGQDVLREGMIKLDLNVHSKASADWRDTVIAVYEHRAEIERIAKEYQGKSGFYIRPIILFQVERTGAKQRLPGFIHAEDVREFLVKRLNVLPDEIAVKSSERDEIENIDLLSQSCPIRYIITKQALQEGWDCPYAYIVTTLTNPEAPTGLTQLIGRVLRQPYGFKTGISELDESHVYCYRVKTTKLLHEIIAGLNEEGLGDLTGRVVADSDSSKDYVDISIRDKFREFAGKVYLPYFVVADGKGGWREARYETDILQYIEWDRVNLDRFDQLALNPMHTGDSSVKVGLDHEPEIAPIHVVQAEDMELDRMFITRQLLDTVPNPWIAYEFVEVVLGRLSKKGYSEAEIRRDLGFVIQELKKLVEEEKERLTKEVFERKLENGDIRFYMVSGMAGCSIPERIKARAGARKLTTPLGDQPQRTLFDYFLEEDFNETEQAVALYLDEQEDILWWYRNRAKLDYGLQGWRKPRVFSDFLAFSQNCIPTVYVLETKGLHLAGNEDTEYKKELFEMCNRLSQPTPWDDIAKDFSDHKVTFQIVFEDEWRRVLNEVLQKEDCP